ncbi:hypothetical protein HDU96_008996 [Phlyctochytrium bullatum]|nr:hypothetical protein HDU96_008996 [Phlyctochytrium bullatum]
MRTPSGNIRDNVSTTLYPIILISDIETNRNSIGFNSYATTERRKVIDEIRATGRIKMSQRVQLSRAVLPSAGVISMTPLFRNPLLKGNQLTRNVTDELYAACYASADCQEVTANAFRMSGFPDGLDLFIWDLDGAANQTYLAHYSKDGHPIFDNYTLSNAFTQEDVFSISAFDYVQTRKVNITDRQWAFMVCARPGYANYHKTSFPIKLFFIALIDPFFALAFHLSIMILHKCAMEQPERKCGLCHADQHGTDDCPAIAMASSLLEEAGQTAGPRQGVRHKVQSMMKKSTKAAIPWLLKFYPLIALGASLLISIPMALYKWKISIEAELTEGKRAFNEISLTARDVCGFIDIDDLPAKQLSNFTNSRDGYTAANINLGLYKNVSFDQRAYWERKLLATYGPNIGSRTNFSIYERSTGVSRRDEISTQLFPVIMISSLDVATPSVIASIGFNAYSDPKDRRAFIEYVAATGLTKTSGRLQLTSSTQPTAGVLMVVPIFRAPAGAGVKVTSVRTAELDAVAWSACEVQNVLTGAMQRLVFPTEVQVSVWDNDGAPGSNFLAYWSLNPDRVMTNYTAVSSWSKSQMLARGYDTYIDYQLDVGNSKEEMDAQVANSAGPNTLASKLQQSVRPSSGRTRKRSESISLGSPILPFSGAEGNGSQLGSQPLSKRSLDSLQPGNGFSIKERIEEAEPAESKPAAVSSTLKQDQNQSSVEDEKRRMTDSAVAIADLDENASATAQNLGGEESNVASASADQSAEATSQNSTTNTNLADSRPTAASSDKAATTNPVQELVDSAKRMKLTDDSDAPKRSHRPPSGEIRGAAILLESYQHSTPSHNSTKESDLDSIVSALAARAANTTNSLLAKTSATGGRRASLSQPKDQQQQNQPEGQSSTTSNANRRPSTPLKVQFQGLPKTIANDSRFVEEGVRPVKSGWLGGTKLQDLGDRLVNPEGPQFQPGTVGVGSYGVISRRRRSFGRLRKDVPASQPK